MNKLKECPICVKMVEEEYILESGRCIECRNEWWGTRRMIETKTTGQIIGSVHIEDTIIPQSDGKILIKLHEELKKWMTIK